MSKRSERLAYGLVSANSGSLNLHRALTKEWRAIRIAKQDRAHLATIAQAPFTQMLPVQLPVTLRPSVQPPADKWLPSFSGPTRREIAPPVGRAGDLASIDFAASTRA